MTRVLGEAHTATIPAARDVPVTACLVGAGLTGALLAALVPRWELDVIDFDVIEPPQRIVPSLGEVGMPKASAVLAYRADRFPWAAGERAVVAEAQAVGEGYWSDLARRGGTIVAATDCPETQRHLAEVARRHRLPYVATGLGPSDVEAFAAPVGGACYGCLGRTKPGRPCIERVGNTWVNPDALPATNSSLHLAATAAAVAVEEAARLATTSGGPAYLVNVRPGYPTIRVEVEPSAACPVCRGARETPREADELALRSTDTFADIEAALGAGCEWEVRVGPEARDFACNDCKAVSTAAPFLVLGRRLVCPECGGTRLLAASGLPAESWVRLRDLRAHTPRELGFRWWPVLDVRVAHGAGDPQTGDEAAARHIELAGDRVDGGTVHVPPLKAGGES